jgi:hypothetical protein
MFVFNRIKYFLDNSEKDLGWSRLLLEAAFRRKIPSHSDNWTAVVQSITIKFTDLYVTYVAHGFA